MKNKKVLARVGAVLACMLLVGALAIPALAVAPDGTKQYGVDWQFLVNNMADEYYDWLGNPSYDIFLSYYNDDFENMAQNGDFALLTGGYVDRSLHNWGVRFSAVDGTLIYYSIEMVASVSAYISDSTDVFVQGNWQDCRISVALLPNSISVDFIPTNTRGFSLYYNSNIDTDEVELSAFLFEGGYNYEGDLFDLDMSITIAYHDKDDVSMQHNLSKLLFGDIGGESVFYPNEEYTALSEAFNMARDTGLRLEQEAYNQGLQDGGSSVDYDEAYGAGYQEAVRQIDSGEFGHNLLGGSFLAPIIAMEEFVLVSWTTQSGFEVEITLMTVFSAIVGVSLFVWFLKMFAGG